MYPRRACPHPYGSFVANGCDIFLAFQTAELAEKIRRSMQTQLRGVALFLQVLCAQILAQRLLKNCYDNQRQHEAEKQEAAVIERGVDNGEVMVMPKNSSGIYSAQSVAPVT